MSEETIFEVALKKRVPAERSAYLDRACGGDAGLRRRVEALLASHERAGDFLEHPAVEQMGSPPSPQGVTSAEPPGDEADVLGFLRPSSRPGSLGRLAHYEVLEILGRGGCGVVMRAFDEKLHRMVAIKVMAPQLAATSPARKRFLREARAAAAVRHENVVGIHAVEDQPIPYLVMEYIPGRTLQQELDRLGPLDVPEVLRVGRQIAGGLAAAHALGLVHRDIKPANILLESGVERRVKITDFGLARAADDASLTQSGLIAGTPLYMSPEQARGDAIDRRADLFSLGSVLYVMCTGRPPFRASSAMAVLKRVTEDSPRPIREIIPEVPNWLCAIIARLHAKEPEGRFASAQEVADLLARHLAKLQQDRDQQPLPGVPATPPAPTPAMREPIAGARPRAEKKRPRPSRKWPWVVTAVAAVLFLLLTGMGLVVTVLWLLLPVSTSDQQVRPVVTVTGSASGPEPREKPGAAPKPQARGPLDLKYIPADAGAALVVHPRRIMQSPLVAGALPPGAAREMLQGLGVEPGQVEQVIVLLQAATPADPPAAPPPPAPAPKDGWTELKSKEGRFSVRFPVGPKAEERKTTIGTRRAFTAEAGDLTFEVSYVDFAKDSPFVGDQSRLGLATRAFEFKPGFVDNKAIKLGTHPGAEVVLDDVQLKTYSVHRVYVVGDRLYNLEARARKARKPPAEFARFFDSFALAGAAAPAPSGPPSDAAIVPAAIIRLAGSADGKQVLTRLLKGLREEKHEGKTYYRSSTGEAILGLPLAGAIPDDGTILLAPEPVLRKMLTANAEAKTPLLDRLRLMDDADEITGVVIVEPHRDLLKGLIGPLTGGLPANLADAAKLPDRLMSVTATVNLADKTLLKVSLEADSEADVEALDKLAFEGLNWARKAYPDFRPTLLKRLPAEVAQPVLAVVDQLYGGVQVTKEGKRLVVRLEKPESLDTSPENDLIASSGFNDDRGMNSDRVPGSPFPLDSEGKQGGAGEPGWAGPWSAHPRATFQSKVVFEGDGALYLEGSPNFGPNYGRQLAQPQTGRFQVEFRVQVSPGSNAANFGISPDRSSTAGLGCYWGSAGKFGVTNAGTWVHDTGFKCEIGRWHKIALKIDVPRQTFEFFVDDKRFESAQPLKLGGKVTYLSHFNFIVTGGMYIDALHVTRLPDDATKDDLIASSGFNDDQGMNSDRVPGSPFPLDSEGKQGGAGEPGWAGPWSTRSSAKFAFQKKVVHEGDGALYMSREGADRRLAQAQRGSFGVEMFVQVPERGGILCYLNNAGLPFRDGPVWTVKDGKFLVLDGPDNFRETGFTSRPGTWHKVALRVDVSRKEWRFFVDDTPFETPKPLRFRNAEASLDTVRFQCETEAGVYIDALRITRMGVVPPPPKDLIASSGFNDARGLNSNPVPGSPFTLDTPNKEGGLGEPGWKTSWPASTDAVYQSKVVFEGDGALYLKGRPNFGPYHRRVLALPQTGRFQLEYHVQVPAGTNYALQLWPDFDSGPFGSGPISAVENGKFIGNDLVDSGFRCEPGRWYKVTMRIDVPKQNWELLVDDKPFVTTKPLGFRAKVTHLSCLNFIVGQGGAYIDAVRVTRLPDAAPPRPATPSRPAPPLPADHIASSGFNHVKGLHGDPEKPPFPLDASNQAGGDGEPGWSGPWPAHPKATFQSKVVSEGDGALYLQGSANIGPNYGRQLAKAQTGKFQVAYRVQVPAGSSFGGYLWQHPRGAEFSGPNWGARDGKFNVYGKETDFKCIPGQWYEVTLRVDVEKHTWEFLVDGKRHESPKPLPFRGKVVYLDYVNFLVEGGVYIDDLRVTRLPGAGK